MRAVILAGQRPGGDPLAQACGIDLKALIPIDGTPMLIRVVDALNSSAGLDALTVITQSPERMSGLAQADWQVANDTPSLSVLDTLDRFDTPLLVTTADHALLTPNIVDRFLSDVPQDVDVAVGMVSRQVIEAQFPAAKRTYWRFRDDGYSGANLFLLRTPQARDAVMFWRRVESNRKKPWQIAWEFGPKLLLSYAARRLTMVDGIARAGEAMGIQAGGVALPFAEAAIDVDKLADLELVTKILTERAR